MLAHLTRAMFDRTVAANGVLTLHGQSVFPVYPEAQALYPAQSACELWGEIGEMRGCLPSHSVRFRLVGEEIVTEAVEQGGY